MEGGRMNYLKTVKTIALALTLGVSLAGCGGYHWKEEVQLSDGKVIIVERELITEGGGDEWAANSSLSKPKEYRIQFADPNDSKKMIEWHSIKKDISTWPEIPLILDMLQGKLVVFSAIFTPGGCLMYNKYLYKNGVWMEEKLPPTFEQRATNLFVFGSNKGFKKYIDVKTKLAIINEHGGYYPYARYDQVGPTHPNCKGL
jgi:hypothetical protein